MSSPMADADEATVEDVAGGVTAALTTVGVGGAVVRTVAVTIL